jgi:hypothetical protein
MEIDKNKVRTLGKDEESAMDQANNRVDAEMKLLESEAKEQVAQGLQDENLARDAEKLRQEAEKELEQLAKDAGQGRK